MDASISSITYESGDDEIATVDNNGLVEGKKEGKTKIIVTADGITKEISVEVISKNTKIKCNKDEELKDGKCVKVEPEIILENAQDHFGVTIRWYKQLYVGDVFEILKPPVPGNRLGFACHLEF